MREIAVIARQQIATFLVHAALAEDSLDAQVLLYGGCVKINDVFVTAYASVRAGDRVSRALLREPANTIWRVGNYETVVAVPVGGDPRRESVTSYQKLSHETSVHQYLAEKYLSDLERSLGQARPVSVD